VEVADATAALSKRKEDRQMDHMIKVSLIPRVEVVNGVEQATDRVRAEPNLLTLQPEDTVTWIFDETVGERNLQVQFEQIQVLPGPNGPFPWLLHEAGRILGKERTAARIERFIYHFVEDGAQVPWDNPIGEKQNFGGLDIPKPPPRG
jgi:hypothetical protein